jgi:hypothetical protein
VRKKIQLDDFLYCDRLTPIEQCHFDLEFYCKWSDMDWAVRFIPEYVVDSDGTRNTFDVALSWRILDVEPDRQQDVARVISKHGRLIKDYYNVLVDRADYPYPKNRLNALLRLPLNFKEEGYIRALLGSLTHIYLIEDGDTGLIKIGRSNNPEGRLKQLVKQDTLLPKPNNFRLLCSWEDYPYIESYLHKTYEEKNVRGEWFALDASDVAGIFNEYLKPEVPESTQYGETTIHQHTLLG